MQLKNLSPKKIDDLLDAGEMLALATSIATGNLSGITAVVGTHASRLLAREILINPRLQNIGRRLVHNLDKGNNKMVAKLMNSFYREVKKKYPEEAETIKRQLLPR